ncbi:hypothetical protein KUF54_01030 [Comamonas sp. Y33R10-2]|uniref:DUF4870 family protein n=1 Tax=Comamonas sp. Y33R10-2 TaxID=2853257 RepID=UPI001C5C92DB|nr:hypothetical protein [Comamonas sp. Y33R10-2]QXZ09891.1 hypothetical protein KUF54_01030 [Comamonas sp. Y33R10-2]
MADDRDIIDVHSSNSAEIQGLKAWGWVSYLLHLVVAVAAVLPGAQVSVFLLIVAVIIDVVKRGDARGTWQESHFSWRLRSVIWAIVLYAVTFPFFLLGLFLFNPAWVIVSIWFLYRIVTGMVAMNKNRAIQS